MSEFMSYRRMGDGGWRVVLDGHVIDLYPYSPYSANKGELLPEWQWDIQIDGEGLSMVAPRDPRRRLADAVSIWLAGRLADGTIKA